MRILTLPGGQSHRTDRSLGEVLLRSGHAGPYGRKGVTVDSRDTERGGQTPASDSDLRGWAEDQLSASPALATPGPAEAAKLVHELRVHQIELEMQNEELRRVQEDLEASRSRFIELYDRAPVGYVTLDHEDHIVEANLRAAGLMGVGRKDLIGRRLTEFVHQDDQDAYYLFLRRLCREGAHESVSVQPRAQLSSGTGSPRLSAASTSLR